MSTENNEVVLGESRKLLSIGNAWVNVRDEGDATKPRLTIKLDRDLGLNITLTSNAQILLFSNKKRADKQDPDFRVAVSIPVDVADREIARQQALAETRRLENMASTTPSDPLTA
jgi:uncharacterized protein (DUF736 family)